MILERDVEQKLTRQVEALGGSALKFIPDHRSGMPDRLVLLPGGHTYWVETKRPRGGKLSSLQRVQHVFLRRLGQVVYVAWTPEQVAEVVESMRRDAGL